jgi:hypothetical protein
MGGGGHSSGGHFSGGHFAAAAGGHFGAAAGGHYYAGPHFASAPGAQTFHAAAHGRFTGTSAMHAATRYSGGGGFVPGWNGGHAWGGGYWHGAFWPHCYFNPGFAWFLPILPFGYATFWWGGLPYYYWNNLYYTWSPGDNGYVVTDPPPVAGTDATDSSSDGTYSGAAVARTYTSIPATVKAMSRRRRTVTSATAGRRTRRVSIPLARRSTHREAWRTIAAP